MLRWRNFLPVLAVVFPKALFENPHRLDREAQIIAWGKYTLRNRARNHRPPAVRAAISIPQTKTAGNAGAIHLKQ